MLRSLHTSRLKRQSSTMGSMVRAAGGTKDSSTSCTILDAELAGLRALLREKEVELRRKVSFVSSSDALRAAELEREVLALKDRTAELSATHKTETATLKSAISKITDERDRCSKNARSIKLQIEEMEKGLLTSRSVIDETSRKMKDDARRAIEQIKNEKEAYEKQMASLESENADIRNQLASRNNSAEAVSALRAELDNNTSETRKLEENLANATKKIAETEEKKRNETAESQANQARIAELTRRNSELETQKNTTLAVIVKLRAELGDLKKQLSLSKDAVVNDTEKLRGSLTSELLSIQHKIREKETTIGELERTISTNATEIKDLRGKLEARERKDSCYNSRITELGNRINVLESEKSDLLTRLATQQKSADVEASVLKQELTRNKSELSELQAALSKTRADHAHEIERMEENTNERLEESQAKQRKLEEKITELTEHNSNLESQKNDTKLQINNLSNQLVNLKRQLGDTRADITRTLEVSKRQLGYDIQGIQKQISEKESNVRDLESEISKNTHDIRDLRGQLDDCKKTEETQTARIKELDLELQDARTKEVEYKKEKEITDAFLAGLQTQITGLELKLARCSVQKERIGRKNGGEVISLNSDISKYKEELNNRKTELADERRSKLRLEQDIAQNEILIGKLTEDKKLLEKNIIESQGKNAVLNASVIESNERYIGLKKEHDHLLAQIEESDRKITELEGRLRDTVDSTATEITLIKNKLADAEARVSTTIKENETLKSDLASSVAERSELASQIANATKLMSSMETEKVAEIETLKRSILGKGTELANMSTDIQSKMDEITELRKSIASSTDQNSKTNAELKECRSKMESKSTELHAMKAEKASLEAQLKSQSDRLSEIERQSKAKEYENTELLRSLQAEREGLASTTVSIQKELSKIEKLFSDGEDSTNTDAKPLDRLQGVTKKLTTIHESITQLCGNEKLDICTGKLASEITQVQSNLEDMKTTHTHTIKKHEQQIQSLLHGIDVPRGKDDDQLARARYYIQMGKKIIDAAADQSWLADEDTDIAQSAISSIGSKSRIEQLEQLNSGLVADKEALLSRIHNQDGVVKANENYISELSQKLKGEERLSRENTRIAILLDETGTKLKNANNQLTTLETENSDLTKRHRDLLLSNTNLVNQLRESEVAHIDYENALNELKRCQAELYRCTRTREELSQERGDLFERNQVMEEAIKDMQNSIDEARHTKAELVRVQANVAASVLVAVRCLLDKRAIATELQPVIWRAVADSVEQYGKAIVNDPQKHATFKSLVIPLIKRYRKLRGLEAPSADALVSESATRVGKKQTKQTLKSEKQKIDDRETKNVQDYLMLPASVDAVYKDKINGLVSGIESRITDLVSLVGLSLREADLACMCVIKKEIASYMTTEIRYLFSLNDDTDVAIKAIKGHTLNISIDDCEISGSLEREKARMIDLADRAFKDSAKPIVDLGDENQDLSDAIIMPEDAPSGKETNADAETDRDEKLKALRAFYEAVTQKEQNNPSEYKRLLYILLLLTRVNVDAGVQGQIDGVSYDDAIHIASQRFDEFEAELSYNDKLNESNIISGIRSSVQGTESYDARIMLQKEILGVIDVINNKKDPTTEAADSSQIAPTSELSKLLEENRYQDARADASRHLLQAVKRAKGSSRSATPVPVKFGSYI